MKLSFDASEIVERFQKELAKLLAKKGASVSWQDRPEQSQLAVRFTEIDQGNQFLRWLLPFLAPAQIHIEGEFTADGSPPRGFVHVQKAQFGIAGGAPKAMLGTCADRLAKDVANGVLRDAT